MEEGKKGESIETEGIRDKRGKRKKKGKRGAPIFISKKRKGKGEGKKPIRSPVIQFFKIRKGRGT